jgi:hypothetical protein
VIAFAYFRNACDVLEKNCKIPGQNYLSQGYSVYHVNLTWGGDMRRWRDQFFVFFLAIALSSSIFALATDPMPILNANRIRILSIDGGGIRGLIVTVILKEIEEQLGKPMAKIFDMVAGSSTGGMIALALTAPDQQKQPRISAKELANIYHNDSSCIFESSWKHWLMNLGGLLGPKYETAGLAKLLKDRLGDTKLSQAIIPTLITGYHLEGEEGVQFFSEDAKAFPNDKDCLMHEVGLATSAAPIYFDPIDIQFPWGKLGSVVDGGLYTNNPSMLAYVTAKKHYPKHTIEIYSLGTGQTYVEEHNQHLKGRGLLQWISYIIDHLQIGNTDAGDAALHQLLNEKGERNYFRLNVRISQSHSSMDNISEENITYLYGKGIEAINTTTFKDMITRLKSSDQVFSQ